MRAALLTLAVAALAPRPALASTQTSSASIDITAVDVGATIGLAAALGALAGLFRSPPPNGWKHSLPGDQPFLDHATATDRATRDTISDVSDYLQDGLILSPFVVDVGATALLARGDLGLAGSMLMMDLEAVAVAGLFTLITKQTVGRVRPIADPCPGTGDDYSCRSSSSRRSFASGHSTAAFASAGLVCAHHDFLDLWGGGAADDAACATALGLAMGSAILRVPSGRHYVSDVLGGAIAGLFAGYVMPYLLHFAPREPRPGVDGALALHGVAGALTTRGDTAFAGGLDAALEHQHAFDAGFAVALGANAAALVDPDGTSFRRIAPWLGARVAGVGAGVVLDYRTRLIDAPETELLVGARLTAAWRRPEHGVQLAVTWLPLVDGDSDDFTARVDVALLRYASGFVEVATTFDDDHTATLGLGGRLPW